MTKCYLSQSAFHCIPVCVHARYDRYLCCKAIELPLFGNRHPITVYRDVMTRSVTMDISYRLHCIDVIAAVNVRLEQMFLKYVYIRWYIVMHSKISPIKRKSFHTHVSVYGSQFMSGIKHWPLYVM